MDNFLSHYIEVNFFLIVIQQFELELWVFCFGFFAANDSYVLHLESVISNTRVLTVQLKFQISKNPAIAKVRSPQYFSSICSHSQSWLVGVMECP